ncbi:MAG TPA: FAD-linked oxidase C-terminal domain-containing protein [Gaiellaceae bacterium]|nr:FAD-linked oxidase C-terminal domain-containing protein [Gaiellaceae bacterium]
MGGVRYGRDAAVEPHLTLATTGHALLGELAALVGHEAVRPGSDRAYLGDATEAQGLVGRADAICLPGSAEDVARVVAWCYEHDVAIVPRGGGTGYAGGAVPIDGGVVVALERLDRVRSFDPLVWRICVEAGVRTARLRRLAAEHGLLFPPDPGGAESSQIGGNIATNAGGPHAFKYGVTGSWVTGLEAVVPPGELISVGGAARKDVAGYDLKSLLVGSEGTLGIVTAAWLRLVPAPEAAFPVLGFYRSAAEGSAAVARVLGDGLPVAALEYLDEGTLEAAGPTFPGGVPDGTRFLVVAEADGAAAEAARLRDEVVAVLGEDAVAVRSPSAAADVRALWRWRGGVSIAVTSRLGWKVSEDVAVPVDRLGEAIAATVEIGRRHGLPACSWGHAGDGNLHSTFLLTPGDREELERATAAAGELFALAVELGGTVSGEHGLGWTKRGELRRQWGPRALALHAAVKLAFDPKGLLNPGKKTSAARDERALPTLGAVTE